MSSSHQDKPSGWLPRLPFFSWRGDSGKSDKASAQDSVDQPSDANQWTSTTLLPLRYARLVSALSRGSTLSLRLGTHLSDMVLESARISALASLGVTRRLFEDALVQAESETERSSSWAESGFWFVDRVSGLAQLATSASFHLTNSILASISTMTQESLHLVDSVFGSTESSRAIATIVKLMKHELEGTIGIFHFVSSLVCFTILQSREWQHSLQEMEIYLMWDVLVLNSGESFSQQMTSRAAPTLNVSTLASSQDEDAILEYIPSGSKYQVTMDEITMRTVTLEVEGDLVRTRPGFQVPKGSVILCENANPHEYRLSFRTTDRKFKERQQGYNNAARDPLLQDQQQNKVEIQPADTRVHQREESVTSMDMTQIQNSLNLHHHGEHRFPRGHITNNLAKYVKFASASYGNAFMRLFGISTRVNSQNWAYSDDDSTADLNGSAPDGLHHSEHYAFANHTELPLKSILLSSYTDLTVKDVGGLPLVHFVAVDTEAKAVVLTIRGTLGLEDILTDLTCNYEDFTWQGRTWKAHGGMLKCAQIMMRKSSRVLRTLARALEENGPDYGLIICGHSLGGGVGALFAILLSCCCSEPETRFVTSSETIIPAGREIHCYVYGPPACISSDLRRETTSLITSVVYGLDIVPCLSLGLLRDFKKVAGLFKEDSDGAVKEIYKVFFAQLAARENPLAVSTSEVSAGFQGPESDDFLWSMMCKLRKEMDSEKLYPPGQVYHLTATTVSECRASRTKQATRIIGRLVVDVEKRFREPVFGRGIFHHSPVYYERVLQTLEKGVQNAPCE